MAEVLTESFCERCGTRYTFESARPRVKRLGGVKVLSRGLKNFVMSDDSSLDEAMAAARSDSEREVSSQQLDAFHKTFNFCMTCRQYTCANCWNEAEGTCLTCSPHLGHEILPAPFPNLDPSLGATVAMSSSDVALGNGLATSNGGNGNGHAATVADAGAWPTSDLPSAQDDRSSTTDFDEIDVAARMAALTAIGSGKAATTEAPVEAEAEAAPVQVEAVAEAEAAPVEATVEAEAGAVEAEAAPVQVEAVAEAEVAPVQAAVEVEAEAEAGAVEAEAAPVQVEAVAVAEVAPVQAAVEVEAEAEAAPVEATPSTDEIAAAAAAQTAALLRRFRPGQSLDAEIEAYEREQVASEAAGSETIEAEPVAAIDAETERASAAAAAAEAERIEAAAEAERIAAAERAAAEAAEAERIAAAAEAARIAAAAEAERIAAAERAAAAAEAERIAAAEETARVAAAAAAASAAAESAAETKRATDVVAQPTWRIVAPDAEPAPTTAPGPQPATPVAPPAAGPAPRADWPTNPEWPSQRPAAGLPFLGRLAQPTGGLDSLWAESNREVATAAQAPGKPAQAGVKPCVSCGLSLSATARFCRRCGTSQVG